MDRLKVFYILGIEDTNDKELIKNAYRSKLKSVNPEDNPEDFKKLREAYEEGIKLCDEVSGLEEVTDNSPIGMWIKRVRDVYISISKRIDINCWKELFEDELVTDFDTCDEAKEALINFLMDNFRLPQEIFLYIDKVFNITQNLEELEELFPKNFLDYFIYQVNNAEFIDFTLFDGNDEADYDNFIKDYLAIKDNIDAKNYENIQKDFDELKRFQIYHPYVDVEHLKLSFENIEELPKSIVDNLTEFYSENIYIRYYLLLYKWNNLEYDNAYEDILFLLEKYPNHYSAKKKLMDYYYIKEEYTKSKEETMFLLDLEPSDEEVLNMMRKNNEFLIEEFKEIIKNDPSNMESSIELAWCYYQNERFDECLTHLESITPVDEYVLDYNNLKGRNYVAMKLYKEALPCLKIWEELLEELEDDGSEKIRKKKRRYGLARYLQALCYSELEEGEENQNKVLECLDFNIDAWDDVNICLSSHSLKAKTLLDLGYNEKCIDVCNHIIGISENYFPAYIYLQEAYYNLKDGQQIIDIFYRAIDIYADYVKPYLLAVKAFYFYSQYEDSKKIIKMAKDRNLESNELDLYDAKVTRYMATSEEATREAIKMCEVLENKFNEENNDIKSMDEISLEKIYGYMDLYEFETALKEVNSLLKKSPTESEHFHIKGRILIKLGKHEEALSLLNQLLEKEQNNEYLFYDVAICYDEMKNYEKAIECYTKVLELCPEHINANSKISNIYTKMYDRKWNGKYYENALYYSTKQLENKKSCYYLIERGLVYTDGRMLDEAIEDYNEAISDEPESIYAYNNLGWVYELQGKYEEAINMYSKAIELNSGLETVLPYTNIANIYMIKHEFDKAYEAYMKCKELFPKKSWYKKIANVYRRSGRYEKAADVYRRALKDKECDEKQCYIELADIYMEKDDKKMAKKYVKKAVQLDPNNTKVYNKYGEYYYYLDKNNKKAIAYYEKAYKLSYDKDNLNSDYSDSCMNLLEVYAECKNEKQVEIYFRKLLEYYEKKYNSIDEYVEYPSYNPARCYMAFKLFLFGNDLPSAKKYLDMMFCGNRCNECAFDKCSEGYKAKGLYMEANGNIKDAIEAYKISYEEDCTDILVSSRLKKLIKN